MKQSKLSIAYTKNFVVKPQFDRHFDSKSEQTPSQLHGSSPKMLGFVSSVHDNLYKTFSIINLSHRV